MKSEKVRRKIDEALEELSGALEEGRSDRLERYLEAMAKFHRYSVGNIMLIAVQRPGATRVAGYRAWQKLGRQVKKGEKAIRIMAPVTRRRGSRSRGEDPRGPDEDERDGSECEAEEEVVVAFTTACVFDISQTEGEPLPRPAAARGRPGRALRRLKRFISDRGIELDYSSRLGRARGVSRGGRITVRAGMPAAEEFSTLAHETAHELLHAGDPGRAASRTVRETEAEAVAHVVCRGAGLDSRAGSSDYIRIWQGDSDTLWNSLKRIRRAAAVLLDAIRPPENALGAGGRADPPGSATECRPGVKHSAGGPP